MKNFRHALALLAFVAAGATHATPQRIVLLVDEVKTVRNLPLLIAEKLGYLRTEAFDVTVMNIRDEIPHAQMLADGRIDAIMAYYHHNLVNAADGRPSQAIVTLGVTPGAKVLVATGAKDRFRTPADLKGARFIAGGAGSSKTTLANWLVLDGGHDLDSYTRLNTDGIPANLAALKEGKADLLVAPIPVPDSYEAEGAAQVLFDLTTPAGTRAAMGTLFPSSTVFMNSEKVRQHPEMAAHLATAFVRTLQFMNQHTAEELVSMIPPNIVGKDHATYLANVRQALPMFATDGLMPADGARKEAAVFAKQHPKTLGVDIGKTYTNTFVERALKAYPAGRY
ncbi:ABC transporter substrate-binding protein [Roseateles sp.]|uniref:ABC transporter substrate-binding protein n=1 Tax=Roseateles sp. TaxID=1971397 RepID=UPI0025F65FC3|nr:ABC transporter substrate-binding protein [Roseateles sp.]MBV8036154.1 ABC transporter substrate-binding protein [Roseateles sp.]